MSLKCFRVLTDLILENEITGNLIRTIEEFRHIVPQILRRQRAYKKVQRNHQRQHHCAQHACISAVFKCAGVQRVPHRVFIFWDTYSFTGHCFRYHVRKNKSGRYLIGSNLDTCLLYTSSFRILKKMKIHLPCHLLPLHRSNDGKQSQSRQLTDLSLHSCLLYTSRCV